MLFVMGVILFGANEIAQTLLTKLGVSPSGDHRSPSSQTPIDPPLTETSPPLAPKPEGTEGITLGWEMDADFKVGGYKIYYRKGTSGPP